jgi:hypothetical protein
MLVKHSQSTTVTYVGLSTLSSSTCRSISNVSTQSRIEIKSLSELIMEVKYHFSLLDVVNIGIVTQLTVSNFCANSWLPFET